ncbi:MAG: TerB family tellurite resistance protein, partial [Bacteroidales bacterium]|nr:TerB family tellurite resistance protein [Bacteroidales bacterium]
MAHLNLSYDELTAVLCLAFHLANADGRIDECEAQAILKALTDQYNFEDKDDLLKEYLESAYEMKPADALVHLAGF